MLLYVYMYTCRLELEAVLACIRARVLAGVCTHRLISLAPASVGGPLRFLWARIPPDVENCYHLLQINLVMYTVPACCFWMLYLRLMRNLFLYLMKKMYPKKNYDVKNDTIFVLFVIFSMCFVHLNSLCIFWLLMGAFSLANVTWWSVKRTCNCCINLCGDVNYLLMWLV